MQWCLMREIKRSIWEGVVWSSRKRGYTMYKRCPKGPPKQQQGLDLGPTCEGPWAMHPIWSSGHSEVAHACCISWWSHPIRESSAMRIGVQQGSGLVLVEKKCQSCSYKGGWHRWTGEAGERLGRAGIHMAQQFLPIIWAVMAITWWSDTGGDQPINHPVKLSTQGQTGQGQDPYYGGPYTRKYGHGAQP